MNGKSVFLLKYKKTEIVTKLNCYNNALNGKSTFLKNIWEKVLKNKLKYRIDIEKAA